MIRGLSVLLILSLSLYWFSVSGLYCAAPLSYKVVALDERFDLSLAEADLIVAEATEAWEQKIGRELFYPTSENSDIEINFIFDDRQASALAEEALRESLDEKEATTENLNTAYEKMVADYHKKREEYEVKVAAYEERLAQYNAVVSKYNEAGGAPERVYEELADRQNRLNTTAEALEIEGQELDVIATNVNKLGERGNEVIRQYNADVNKYNNKFGVSEEFTQGDYQSGSINIYTFTSKEELLIVMAHELGHTLDIGHVEGSESIMYYLMEDQPIPLTLSGTDFEALLAKCGVSDSLTTDIRTLINKYLR